MTSLHLETLDGQTGVVLAALGASPAFRGFYLAGGTALALQLGHRTSLDLDLFSERPWLLDPMLAGLRAVGPTVVDREAEGTLVGTVSGVRISLFHYPFLLVDPPLVAEAGLPLAGLRDIAAMKLVAVGQRGSRKDFVDLYFLGRAGVDVAQALEALAHKMPGVEHNPVHIARSLAYFTDAESEPEPRMLTPFDWRDATAYCLAQSRRLLQRIIETG
jgi:hypothetical protein